MRKNIILLIYLCIISTAALAQTRITGVVIDAETGETLPGSTIVIEGKSIGASADVDGKFSIDVSGPSDVLIVSFIGYNKEKIIVGNQTNIKVLLNKETTVLEDVIVTAIGIKREKKEIGYAAQDVKGDDLIKTQQSNIVNALSSKVAGISVTSSSGTPGASADIVIRGRSSLTAGRNAPLFVVDGVPIDNGYSGSYVYDFSNRAIDLNSDDVESVSVLKGAAASALYGIRAANGAIIVTTKSGKSKGINKNITFKTTFSFDRVSKLPEKQYKYAQGAFEKGKVVYFDDINFSWGPLMDTLRYDGATDYLKDKNGRIVNMSDPSATDKRVVGYDNIEDFFETAMTNNTYLSMSGGNDKGNYLFSVGRLSQSGIVPNTKFERVNFKISGENKLSDKMKISGSASYSNSKGDYAQKGSNLSAVMVGLMRCTPTFDLTNGVSNPADNPEAYMYPDGTQRNYYSNYDNPYWSVNKNRASDKVDRIMGNSQIDVILLPWLTAMYRVGIDNYTEERNSFFDNNSSDTPNGYVTLSTYTFSSLNSDFLITVDKKITEDLNFTAILGHNYLTKKSYNNFQQGDSLILPNFYNISNTAVKSGGDYRTNYKIVGTFYDIKLAYKNFLFFNTTGRNDWTSTLAKGNNSFFYPSFSASFILTDAFNIDNEYLTFGKIRASWAEVGNDAPVYALQDYYSPIQGGINGQTTFATQRTMGNKGLKPETTRSSELGIDFRFFKNKLGVDIAFYQSKTIDQIVKIPVTYSTGYEYLYGNGGVVSNKGIEAQVFVTPFEFKDFKWDMMFNFAKNKNMVEDLPEGVPFIEFETTGISTTRSLGIEGQPYGVIFGSRYLRNEEGQVLVNNNGLPLMDATAGIVGDPNPDFTLGIRNTFTYKSLTFTALVDIKKGGDVWNGTKSAMKYLGTHKETENRDEDFIFPGVNVNTGLPNNVVIKRNFAYYSSGGLAGISEAGIEDGSYVRLREVALSYTLPKKWTSKAFMKDLTIGVSGRNLLLFTNYTGIDPETNLSGTSNSLGRDYFNMPNTKSIEFNLQVTF